MDFSLLRAAFRRTLGAPSRTRRRPRRSRRPPSGSAFAGLHLQVLEPRLALAADTASAKPFWGNGHYYAVTHANDDWHTAYRESRATTLSQLGITGGLAAVTSAEENAFIANYATGRSDPSRPNYGGTALQWEAFLAGADTGDMGTWEGRWQWFTGDGNPDNGVVFRDGGADYGYSNWWSRQPDNKGNEDFLAIYPGGGWNDVVIRQSGRLGDYVTEWGRAGVEFHAGFAGLGQSGTRNGAENGDAATMTISFDRHVPGDYVDIRDGTPLIDIPITFGGTATVGVDYDMTVSGGWSYFHNGRLYVRNTQSVVLTFTPRNNDTWQAPRTITASLGGDGAENIYGISGNATSQVWIFDDEPLLSLGQGAYQFIRAPYTAGSSQTLPENNADFNTNADTLIFDTDGIGAGLETEARFNEQGFYDSFAMRWESYVRIPETGSYRFRTWSDDGSILTVRQNNGGGVELASISDWVGGGGRGGVSSPISLQKGDVVWFRYDMFEITGPTYAHLNWDRPDGNGGMITHQPIPGSLMFLSESLARGVDRTEPVGQDTSGLGFQLFANQPTNSVLNVRLASTSEASNSTVETSLAQRQTDSRRVGDDYAIEVGGSQITTDTIGLNDTWGTLRWQPNKAAGSLQNLQTFEVLVLSDSYAEATESVTLKLGTNAGYGVSNDSQTLTISDNPIVLSVRAGKNPQEGAGDEGDLGWFTVSTNGRVDPEGGLRVRYAITGGTATRNADFTAPQATLGTTSYLAEDLLVMPAGATEARISIAALADAIREGDETVTLELMTNVEADNQNFRFQRYNIDAAARQATLTIHDSAAYAAAVVTTPADRSGLGTIRGQLTGGQQVASFDVHVTSQPRANVVVTLATTSGSLSTQQVTFTSSNWTQPQRVTLTGLRTDQITTVSVTTASSDQQYASLATQQRIVPSNWASELELSLWEGGVLLAAQPAASVEPVDGTESSASRFGFELSLGSPVVGSPVDLLYTLSGRDGFTFEGDSADVRHEPDATYRPLVLTNSVSGSAAFVNLGSLTTVSDAGEFSAQAWVRRDRADGGDTVLEFSNASGHHQIWLGFPDSTNQPRLQLRSSSGAVLAQLTGDAPLALSEWNHLAFSIDRDKVASLYVNGELVARQTLSSGLSRLARSSNLLGRALSSENRLAGAVRAVAIWNAARTQDEIRASMLDETASGSGLVSSLPLNNSLANGVSSAPAAVLSNGTAGNTAGFATAPLYGLRLAVGESRVVLPLDVRDDLTAEGTKSLTLSLVGSGRYSSGGPSGTGTAELTDDDRAEVEFLAAWSNLDASSSGWTSTSQFRISEADQATNTQTRLGIRLTSRPTADVRLSLRTNSDVRVSRPGQAGGSAVDLVFTPATWDEVQELLLQGVDDSSVDGDITRQLSFQVTSGDRAYAELAPSLSVLVLDDDMPAVGDDQAAGQSSSAPVAVVSAPSQSRIAESGTDSAEFTITLSAPAERDTLVFFDLEQSNRQLFASDISVTPSQNAQALKGLARFEGNTPILKVNFQSGNATTPSGYVSDSGHVFGDRGNGWTYGWSKDHTNQGRDRNRNSDQRLDTLVHFRAGATWEIALPNGVYEVTASVGDARHSRTHTLNVEGVSYFAATPLAANSFALETGFVTVSDGRLTLDMGAASDMSTRINYLEIKEIKANAAGVDADGIDETSGTFAALGQAGDFSTTWSGYVAIPETGFYRFSVPTQGGVRLTLDGRVVIDQMIDTRATWSTDLLQLNRGDVVPFSLDYQSFNTAEPAVALHWQRPTSNNTDSVSDPVPAQALSRVDGFHLLIAQGSSSATVTVRGIDDAIAEGDEALAVRLLSSRGVELVVTGQGDDTHGVSELAITLGITDRESVALAAGTVLDFGRRAAAGAQRTSVALFRVSDAATVHRGRTARLRGTLTWVDEATRTSLGGSVVDLVAGADGELYQVLDRSVTLAVAGPLTADSAAGQGRYLASLTLQPTNRGRVELAAGTRLVYFTETTEETVTLVLVDSLTLQSGETKTAVAVSTEERSRDLDLTSAASPLVGLTTSLELPEVATLTITDDDQAGLLFSLDREGYRPVDGSRHSLAEQGDSLIRYVSLTSQPNDAVTVYLETDDASEARLQIHASNPAPASARIAFTFTPEDWQTAQAFRIVPHDDRLVDGDQTVGIFSRTTSSDSFYAIPSAGRLDFVVRDNDASGVLVELQQSSITRAGNGFLNLSLTAEPTANVVVTLTPSDHQFTINDRSVGRGETLVFTPENWSTLQTVGLTAVDDSLVEDLSTSELRFSISSSDAHFHTLAVDPVRIVITDNDLPTATLELVNDGSEDGRPGRFRIRLSAPAPASAGSKGVLVNYRVTAVGLDPALPYGSDVAGRLEKIVQSPTGVSGTVRIAPGQSVSDVLVVPIDDSLPDRPNKSVSVQLTSGDGYAVATDSAATSATVQIINNDVAGILVMTSGERILVKESGAIATYQLALLSEPRGDVTVTITEKVAAGGSRQLGTSTTPFATTVTFTRTNWFTPQQISVRAYDDLKIEDGSDAMAFTGIHPAELSYHFSSTADTDYDTARNPSGHFTRTVQQVDVLDIELSDTTATAMQAALTTLQEGIDSLALPIVGSLDGKTGQGLRKFITNLANSIRQVGSPTPMKLSRLISREIASALGVPEQAVRVELSMKDVTSGNPAVVVRFGFADAYTVSSVPLAADFGLPGLGFQTKGSFDAAFSYEAGLELVFPRSGDISLETGSGQTFVRARYNAGLTDEFRLTGGMGLMQLDARNQPSVNDNVKIAGEPASTELDVGFVLTVGGGAGGDAKLTFTELTSSSLDLEQVFQYGLSGNAAMSFGVTTSVAGLAAIPSFTFDLSALLPLFDYSNQAAAAEAGNATSIYFDNIRLDLGSFITDLLDPIVGGLDDVLGPLYPLVDALYSDTQIFTTVGLAETFDVDRDGKTSAIDLSRWFANFYAKIDSERGEELKASVDDTVEFLDMLKGVMDLVRDLERLGDEENFFIDYGSYELAAFSAGSQDLDPADVEVDESSAPNLSSNTKQQADAGGRNPQSGRPSSSFQKMMGQANELGFRFPLIEDPVHVVKLLLGQEATLFEWRMPGMGMTSEVEEYYPIFAGVEGIIKGGFEVKAHLGFGFDTYGLSQWRRDAFAAGSAWKVFNGFYVADLDEHGRDVPEFSMDASMGAGLGYNARVVRADITGGLVAAARMDLLDEGEIAGTSDGKIRGQEISSRISNPLSLFELSGELIASLQSRVQIGVDAGLFSIWKTVWEKRLAEIPVFAFGIGGRYGSGVASNGLLEGATVFFDANFNGRIDSLEPFATTDANGHYSLEVDLRTFDKNHNGQIDADEGQLVVFGGTDTTIDQPLAMPFVGPLGSMITPLTSLHNLAVSAGVPAEEVRSFISEVFALGDFDYLTRDPLTILAEATSFDQATTLQAANAYLAHIKLHFAWDLMAGGLRKLMPDAVPDGIADKLELLKGFAASFRERPTPEVFKESLGRAIAELWGRVNPDSDPLAGELAARAAELAAAAGLELTSRLDRIRDEALQAGASPADLLVAINDLKTQAFGLYREALDGISEGLYRITDPGELVRTVSRRLKQAHGDFINKAPTLEIPAGFTTVEDQPLALVFPAAPFGRSDATAARRVTVTVQADRGAIIAASGRGVTVGGTGRNRVFTGTLADLNRYFTDTAGRIRYRPAANDHGTARLTVTVVAATPQGVLRRTATSAVAIAAVNDAPVARVPGVFRVTEDVRGAISWAAIGRPFADVDSTALTVTLAVRDGVIDARSADGVTVGGTATVRTFAGSAAALNAFFRDLGRIGYTTAPDNEAPRLLRVTVFDGQASTTATTRILVRAVNDAPTIAATTAIAGGRAGRPLVITHAMLRVASGVRDPEQAPLRFTIQSVQAGRIEKRVAGRWVPVVFHGWPAPVVRPGEQIRWIPPARARGTVAAFTIRGSDGVASSAVTSRVTVDVAG